VRGLTKIGRGPSDECFEDSSAALVRDVLPHEAAACFARVRRYVAWIAEHKRDLTSSRAFGLGRACGRCASACWAWRAAYALSSTEFVGRDKLG
jgi:hypothetical protein